MKDDHEMANVPKGQPPTRAPARNFDGPGGVNVLPPGTHLNEFEIIDLIGEGGFGIVYLAYDHSLKRHVALKEYMPSGLASRTRTMCVTAKSEHHAINFAAGLRSFVNEARLLAQFDSPFLVKVYRFWEANGTAYMVMPFYEGKTLKQALKEGKIVPNEEWIKGMLAKLFDAVEMMHRARCYHRDIAPDNILLLKDGSPLLLDFGAARRIVGSLTQCLTVIVKPGFAPIEQYADIPGLKQGTWTDVYALAAVVYYLISGKPPAAVARILNDEMVPAREVGKGKYSESFLAGLDKALAVRPEQRIQSVAELRKVLGIGEALKGAGPPPQQARKPAKEAATETLVRKTAAERPAPAAVINHTTLLNHDADWPQPAAPVRPAAGVARKSRKLPMLALGFLVSMGVAGGAAWSYLKFSNAKPAKRAAVTASVERQPSSGSSGTSGTSASSGSAAASGRAGPMVPPPRSGSQAQATAAAPAPRAAAEVAKPAPATPVPPPAPATEPNRRQEQVAAAPARPALPTEAARPAPLPEPVRTAPPPEPARPAPAAPETLALNESRLKAAPGGRDAEGAGQRPESSQSSQANPVTNKLPATPRESARSGSSRSTPALAKSAPAAGYKYDAGSRTDAAAPAADAKDESAKNTSGAEAAAAPPPPAPESATGNGKALVARSAPSAAKPTEPVTSDAKAQAPDATPKAAQEQPQQPQQPHASGKKTIKFADQTMTGDFTADPVTGIVSGKGRIVWTNGNQFEGTLVKGVKEGRGQFIWSNGQRYTGEWSHDSPNGKGVLVYANGNRYEGEVKNGIPNGQGTTRFKGGDVYSGTWVNGKSHGHGRYTWASGSYFEGEFKDDRRTENGQLVVVNNGAAVAADGSR